ncbi:MAG: hypothetical protein V6Z86_03040 [Hyphomicrobiales bacterium]
MIAKSAPGLMTASQVMDAMRAPVFDVHGLSSNHAQTRFLKRPPTMRQFALEGNDQHIPVTLPALTCREDRRYTMSNAQGRQA